MEPHTIALVLPSGVLVSLAFQALVDDTRQSLHRAPCGRCAYCMAVVDEEEGQTITTDSISIEVASLGMVQALRYHAAHTTWWANGLPEADTFGALLGHVRTTRHRAGHEAARAAAMAYKAILLDPSA